MRIRLPVFSSKWEGKDFAVTNILVSSKMFLSRAMNMSSIILFLKVLVSL